MQFSANLGFLYQEFPLQQAFHEAARDGFAAVELHWPFAEKPEALLALSQALNLPILALNTPMGAKPGDFGLAAVKGREDEFWQGFIMARDFALACQAPCVHVMAGIAGDEATFCENLAKASAEAKGLTLLIEPINHHDRPGYFLHQTVQALALIAQLALPNVKLMLDLYHAAKSGENARQSLEESLPHLGHVQIASLPDRHEPDQGSLDYAPLFHLLKSANYTKPIGAEYRPRQDTKSGLDWLRTWRNIS